MSNAHTRITEVYLGRSLDDNKIEDDGPELHKDAQRPKTTEGNAGSSLNENQLDEASERRKGKRRSKTIALIRTRAASS